MTTPTTPVWKKAANGAKPAEDLEGLEELGSDAIIAQESIVHAPQRRVQVKEESQSIVISDSPPPSDPRTSHRVHHAEKTLVIRDRRKVEELRRSAAKKYGRKQTQEGFRALTIWVVAGLAAFAFGGLIALFASRGDPEPADAKERDPTAAASDPESAAQRPAESEAREPGARELGARELGARELGARELGARELGARERARPILNLDKESEPVSGDVVELEELPVEKR